MTFVRNEIAQDHEDVFSKREGWDKCYARLHVVCFSFTTTGVGDALLAPRREQIDFYTPSLPLNDYTVHCTCGTGLTHQLGISGIYFAYYTSSCGSGIYTTFGTGLTCQPSSSCIPRHFKFRDMKLYYINNS